MQGILEAEEASQYLKISKVSLLRYARSGLVPAFKMGRYWKFDKEILDEWIHQRVKVETKYRQRLKRI